ncbi:hypothetical protein PG993_012716 [Apiospora rasikravindrae]|uniref:DUF7907 domain-containing protein n=1 Tax=Apiospora rasikravindrae TaxID=990691 RepID=A0ABR1S4M7_9PEZI
MLFTLPIFLGLLGLASAAPLESRGGAPIPEYTTGVQLAFNVTNPQHELYDRVHGMMFSSQRLSQGVYMAVAVTREQGEDGNPAKAPVFYFADSDGPASATVLRSDIPGVYPMGTYVAARDSVGDTPGEHHVSLATGLNGTAGLFSWQGADNIPYLTGPAGSGQGGTYTVCPRTIGAWDLLLINYVYPGETVAADCAPGNFVVLCATLPETEWSSGARSVPCVRQ